MDIEGSRLTRRRFVAAGSLGAVAVLAPQAVVRAATKAPTLGGKAFAEGVISGDPTPSGITLWSRVTDASGSGSVELEVAKEKSFKKVVTRKLISTSENLDHSVKAKITGLDPYEQYYYRFSTNGGDSSVGRFRTALPSDSNEKVRFGYFSCQEFSFGFFNAHALLAKEDVDFVVNLGDYVYQDVKFPLGPGAREAPLDVGSASTLEEFRDRYKAYRSDSNLRAMHAAFPMITTWDDHEVQDNYAGGSSEGGEVRSPYSKTKRDDAYRAFFEAMPTYAISGKSRLYHKAKFGKHVDLFVLDERQYRASQFGSKGDDTTKLSDPRSFLGSSQLQFAQSELTKSKASWKVVANEVPIFEFFEANGERGNVDIWQGYPTEREALLRTIRDKVDDVVFVTGDYHVFMAGDVRTVGDGRVVATEFVGGSITSASNEEILSIARIEGYGTPDDPKVPKPIVDGILKNNPWIDQYDPIHHGYVVCEADSKTFKATFKKLDTIRRKSTKLNSTKTYTVKRGVAGIQKPTKT